MAQARKSEFMEEVTGRPSRAKPTPEFAGGRPKCPRHLSKPARAEWKRCVRLMEERKTITPQDYALLAVYATVFGRWLAALEQIGEQLMIDVPITDNHGVVHMKQKLNPLLPVAQKCEAEIKSIAEKLGLTPVSRARVNPTTPITPEYVPGTIGFMLQQGAKK